MGGGDKRKLRNKGETICFDLFLVKLIKYFFVSKTFFLRSTNNNTWNCEKPKISLLEEKAESSKNVKKSKKEKTKIEEEIILKTPPKKSRTGEPQETGTEEYKKIIDTPPAKKKFIIFNEN